MAFLFLGEGSTKPTATQHRKYPVNEKGGPVWKQQLNRVLALRLGAPVIIFRARLGHQPQLQISTDLFAIALYSSW